MPRPRRKAGYSVLEVLIVLAIMAMASAIVMPRGLALLDRVMTHVVFFELQREVSDLRREAYRTESPVTVAADPAAAGPEARALTLPKSWSYRLNRPLLITAGGVCEAVAAEVFRDGASVMHLVSEDRSCRFIRRD
ncbi:MAG: prepilin-type N-terminal cleavage/methylation domain-containing protein [Pseudomonadota bacterium]